MNRDDIIRIAEEAGFFIKENEIYSMSTQSDQELTEWIERFAALVAKHTLANIDPSSFMSWQEGYEAGKQTEREAWEHRYARLQSLMDVRETQPNKPCCLAEREACAKVCEDAPEPDGADLAERIRARGQE